MKKFAISMAAIMMASGGLVGCGDNQAGDLGADMRNVGYEDVNQRGDVGVRDHYRGEGPVTDMMTVDDRRDGGTIGTGLNNQRNVDNGFGNQRDMTRGNANDKYVRNGNRGFMGQDRHQGLRNTGEQGLRNTGEQGQVRTNDGQNNAQKIDRAVERMDEVEESHVVVRENDVIIGVDTNAENGEEIASRIKEKVEGAFNDQKEVYVTVDDDDFAELGDMNEAIGNGEPVEEFGSTINTMIEDLGDAAQRPFERTRD